VRYRFLNPFEDPTEGMDSDVNPFVGRLAQGARDRSLPVVVGKDLAEMPGRWRASFQERGNVPRPETELIVEIGCHKGQTLREMASGHPEHFFVGIDITYKRVVTAAERAVHDGLPNVLCSMADARHLDKYFSPGEIDGILLFFPDPWPKRRQEKNRLFNESFCQMICRLLKPQGFLWFRTDYAPYFEEGLEVGARCGLRVDDDPKGLLAERYVTTFERKADQSNVPSQGVIWRKP
jgi:tRNA (guanine-N7-)-methyltransferase